ncbi:hypothetical protein Mpal_0365 [Methanosphaerula palustris E1-9c]|uniref:Uncharacterized protein n=1 Tax=Methanosphaerula palustris (strain ATCC BAA-1556 / DSM 19958 / E1-9c) TaxID=521011 RepID=B8GJT9_METPE|nr:hypothetical protein Mpal_0365 [Methanosphaerula palustris E1-9c]
MIVIIVEAFQQSLNKLLKALFSYKLTDNFSIKRANEWINRDEVGSVPKGM